MSRDDCRPESPRDGPAEETSSYATLLAQVHAGSEEAAKTLYDRHSKDVLAAIRDLLGARDPLRRRLDSVDAAQEAWLSAFEALKRGDAFADERAFVYFLHKVTVNCVGMLRRAAAAEKRSLGREEPLAGRDRAAKVPGPAELAESVDEWKVFLTELLPPDRVMVARCIGGTPVSQIALDLGLNVRFVQRRIAQARLQWMERQHCR